MFINTKAYILLFFNVAVKLIQYFSFLLVWYASAEKLGGVLGLSCTSIKQMVVTMPVIIAKLASMLCIYCLYKSGGESDETKKIGNTSAKASPGSSDKLQYVIAIILSWSLNHVCASCRGMFAVRG